MLTRRRGLMLAASAVPFAGAAAQNGEAAVRELLTRRVEVDRDSVGYVAAMVDADGVRLLTAGRSDAEDGRPLDGDSVFEIGSITKVFTALLLADMVGRGEVALGDPVAKYLPAEGRPLMFDGKAISLLDLVTYTSGLPRMPGNFRPKDPANPYADYTVEQLYAALSGAAPLYYPGSHYEYANLGFGLLGHALALRAGRSFEELVVERICAPLGLDDTRITLTPSMRQRFVPAHDAGLAKVPHWDIPTLAGAGALRSTANDLLRLLDACQGRRETKLAPAFARLLDVRRQADAPQNYVGAGWFLRMQHDDEIVWKDGGTGGHATFIGYSKRSGHAAVLLANAASYTTTTQIGWHLVNPAFALPGSREQVVVAPEKLAGLAGRYPITRRFVLTVTPRDGRLMVQATGQAEYEVFAESETRFFYRVVDAQLDFELGEDGVAKAVVLHQNGRDMRAVRAPQ